MWQEFAFKKGKYEIPKALKKDIDQVYNNVQVINKLLGKMIVEKKASHSHMANHMVKGVKEYREIMSLVQKAKVLLG